MDTKMKKVFMPKLCPISSQDCKTVYHWRNSTRVNQYMYNQSQIAWDEHANWFNNMLNSRTSVYWTIEVERKKIGLACINEIDRASCCGDWAFYIAEENFRGAGIGSAVELFVTNYGFNFLRLNKMYCEVLCWNKAIIRMHQKFGFHSIGKKNVFIRGKGKIEEVECFSMEKTDWVRNKEKNLRRLKAVGLNVNLVNND